MSTSVRAVSTSLATSLRAALPSRRGAGEAGGTSELWRNRRWRWSTWGAIWLVFLVNVAGTVWQDNGPAGRVAGVALLLAFVAVFLLGVPLLVVRPPLDRARWLVPALLLALGTALVPLAGEAALATYVYVVVTALALVPPPWGLVSSLVLTAGAAAAAQLVPGWGHDPIDVALPMVTAGMAVYSMTSLLRRNRELMAAREEIARLAVSEERLRFARDVHDLLGHSLTVVTVKAQLARRLLDTDPARAAAEIAEVERLSREALHDVRATVSGYRAVTLAGELATARTSLAGAGLAADLPDDVDVVPRHLHEPFGWVVREGVTNLLRHGHKVTRCAVRLGPTWLEVVDDGHADWATASRKAGGNGLRGLQERVAAVDGRVSAGWVPGGGYRLRVDVVPPQPVPAEA